MFETGATGASKNEVFVRWLFVSIVFAAFGVLGVGAPRASTEPVPRGVLEDAVGSVGLVRSAGGNGTGWVARDATVITNLHVAKGGTGDIYMDFSDGERVECYTAIAERDVDLAVLRCSTAGRDALEIDPAIPVAPPPADTDSVEIVEEGVRPALASSDAQELLDSLRDKLAVHDDLQLTLSWRLERRRKG